MGPRVDIDLTEASRLHKLLLDIKPGLQPKIVNLREDLDVSFLCVDFSMDSHIMMQYWYLFKFFF